ncbi:MAG: cytidylate kinase-like family protein [Ruminococcus sp.]|nr:cytidylate kinase-like family protein [Ruminococcus sp.]
MSKIKVVTIGRQYCSGGSDIGRSVAEKLGVKCYDREIVEMAAERSGISMADIKKYEESVLGPMAKPISFFSKEVTDITERIFAAETQVVMELAGKEPCVIVGRCADFILKNKVKTLNVFIYASEEKRLETAMGEKHNIPAEEAKPLLKKYDKKRSSYYNANTNKEWGRKASYDICLDSGKLGYEMCAQIIAHAVQISK